MRKLNLNPCYRTSNNRHAIAYTFQEDLWLTLMRIEQTYFNLAKGHVRKNVLIICDRGAMDPSAFLQPEEWHKMLEVNHLAEVQIRDRRYDQVIHM